MEMSKKVLPSSTHTVKICPRRLPNPSLGIVKTLPTRMDMSKKLFPSKKNHMRNKKVNLLLDSKGLWDFKRQLVYRQWNVKCIILKIALYKNLNMHMPFLNIVIFILVLYGGVTACFSHYVIISHKVLFLCMRSWLLWFVETDWLQNSCNYSDRQKDRRANRLQLTEG